MRRKKLSKSELELMKICWEKGQTTVRDIYEETLKKKKRGYQTVKTLLDRMVEKKYLNRNKNGLLCLYEPAISREDILKDEIDTLADSVLDTSLVPFFTHMAEKEKLTPEEINMLKALIEKHKEDL